MTRQARRNVFWSGLEAAISGLLSFTAACVVARLVGPSELGLGAAAVAVHVVLWVAANGLFADALVQRGATDAETIGSAVWASFGVGVVAALLQVAAGWLLAAWFADPRLLRMGLLLAVSLPLVGAAGAVQGVLTMRRAYRALAWRTIIGQGLGTLVGISAAWVHAGAWAPVLQQCVVSGAGTTTLLIGVRLGPPSALRWHAVRGLLRVGLPLTASTLVLAGRYRLFAVLIGGVAGATTLGQVHMAFRLVDTLRDLATTAQWRLMLPILAEQQHEPAALRATVDRLLGWSSLAMLPLCGALALALPLLVPLVLGPAWLPSGLAAEPLALLMALLSLMFPSGVALVARGRTTPALIGNAAITTATALGALLVTPATPLRATLLWVAMQALVLPYLLWVNGRALDTGPFRPLRAGLPMLLMTLTAAAIGLLVPMGIGIPIAPHG